MHYFNPCQEIELSSVITRRMQKMAPFQFVVKLVHVLSSVFAVENGQTTFRFLRETSLSSGQCQNEHGLKCQ